MQKKKKKGRAKRKLKRRRLARHSLLETVEPDTVPLEEPDSEDVTEHGSAEVTEPDSEPANTSVPISDDFKQPVSAESPETGDDSDDGPESGQDDIQEMLSLAIKHIRDGNLKESDM